MDVTKGKTCYAIKVEPTFKDKIDAHKKEIATTFYLNCYFSPINPNYQKWMDEGIINDFFGFEVNFTDEAASILFYMDSDNKDDLIVRMTKDVKFTIRFTYNDRDKYPIIIYINNIRFFPKETPMNEKAYTIFLLEKWHYFIYCKYCRVFFVHQLRW